MTTEARIPHSHRAKRRTRAGLGKKIGSTLMGLTVAAATFGMASGVAGAQDTFRLPTEQLPAWELPQITPDWQHPDFPQVLPDVQWKPDYYTDQQQENVVPNAGPFSVDSLQVKEALDERIYNDPFCKPAPEHPNPVIFLHGTTADSKHSIPLARVLKDAGYCVYSPTYGQGGHGFSAFVPNGGGQIDITKAATEVGGYVDNVLAATGASKVDLIGHSLGGLVAHTYMHKYNGYKKVHHLVGLGGSYHGTDLLGFTYILRPLMNAFPGVGGAVVGQSTEQQMTGSEFLQEMSKYPETVPGVKYTNLYLKGDTTVSPGDSATLQAVPGADVVNAAVEDLCPSAPEVHHTKMPVTEHTIALTRWALGRADNEQAPAPETQCKI